MSRREKWIISPTEEDRLSLEFPFWGFAIGGALGVLISAAARPLPGWLFFVLVAAGALGGLFVASFALDKLFVVEELRDRGASDFLLSHQRVRETFFKRK